MVTGLGEIPEVHRWPYDYSKPGHDEDFVTQVTPMKEGRIWFYITKIFPQYTNLSNRRGFVL